MVYKLIGVDDLSVIMVSLDCSLANGRSFQVIRSVSQWSAGTSRTEDSIHIAYCSLIEKAEHFIYIEVHDFIFYYFPFVFFFFFNFFLLNVLIFDSL